MRRWSRTIVALLTLAVFLASVGTSAFSSARLAHDLEHDSQTAGTAVDHHHAPPLSTDGSPDPEPLSDVEHQRLHAMNYCQSLPGSTIAFSWEPPARTTPLLSNLLVLLPAELEPPFRPPRAPALI